MQLDIGGPPDDPKLLAPPEWTMDVRMDVQKEVNMYTAEVKRSLVTMCRLSIATSVGDEAAARTALAHKARVWIRAYLERSQPE
jgi:hypothetical protein